MPRTEAGRLNHYLQSDGYSAYPCWLNKPEHTAERDAIIHAGCWAHARRKFAEATDSISRKIVRLIAKLYRIETELREKPELDRSAVRQQKSAPILDNIKTILDREKERQLPKSTLGEAIRYTLARWDSLTRYLEHSWLEIDNNLVETRHSPPPPSAKRTSCFSEAPTPAKPAPSSTA